MFSVSKLFSSNLIMTACVLILLTCCQQKVGNIEEKITIATAANMQFAIKELTEEFAKKTGIKCDLVISSSGKLTAQIKEGAPFDILVAANMKYPEEIFNSGLAEMPPKVYAYGKLVLWSMVDGIMPSIESLNSEGIQHIALANPKIAPYGAAAIEVLSHYNLAEMVEPKLVYGESISQTNQFITTQSAEVGFTALSVVLSPKIKGKGQWVALEEGTYTPIQQGVVVVSRKNVDQANTQKFYDYLFSEEAKRILKAFGYAVVE